MGGTSFNFFLFLFLAVVSAVGVISTGGLVGIILAALVVIVAALVVTGLIIWQVA